MKSSKQHKPLVNVNVIDVDSNRECHLNTGIEKYYWKIIKVTTNIDIFKFNKLQINIVIIVERIIWAK